MPAKTMVAAGVIPLAALTRGMARKQSNSTTTSAPATAHEPEFGDRPSDRTDDPLETRRPAQEHAPNARHGGGAGRTTSGPPARAPAEDPTSPVIVIPEDDETDITDDDLAPLRTGSGPLPTPERPRRYSAPETPGPSAYDTPSRPPQPAPTRAELLARKGEQTLLNKSPVRTSGVTTGRRTVMAPPRTVLGTPIPAAPAPATARAVTAEVAQRPPTASAVTRNTVALYEEVQRVADGLEELIRKHVARFPSEASRLSQHIASAFATFINPQPTAPTSDQTTTKAPDTRARSYAAAATAGAQRPPPPRPRPAPTPMTRPNSDPANPPYRRPAAGHTRIFARLPEDNPLRKADPVVILEKANCTPGLTNLFISAYHIPSGLALITADPRP